MFHNKIYNQKVKTTSLAVCTARLVVSTARSMNTFMEMGAMLLRPQHVGDEDPPNPIVHQ